MLFCGVSWWFCVVCFECLCVFECVFECIVCLELLCIMSGIKIVMRVCGDVIMNVCYFMKGVEGE